MTWHICVSGLLSGSVNERTCVGGKLTMKAVFDVLANQKARRGVQRSGSIPESFDVSRGRMDDTVFINAEMYGKLGSGAKDGFSTR